MVSLKKVSKVERGPAGNEETQREREGTREISDCACSHVHVYENVTVKANIYEQKHFFKARHGGSCL